MRVTICTLLLSLLLVNSLWASSVTMLEVGHYDATGGPLRHASDGSAAVVNAASVCELFAIATDGEETAQTEFPIGHENELQSAGYFLSGWIAIEFTAESKLLLRVYPDGGNRLRYFESPCIELLPGRQQVSFATSEWSFHEAPTSEQSAAVEQFSLKAVYPNPFNAAATFEFELPQASHVKAELFNLLGQRASIIIDSPLDAGSHQAEVDGSHLATGVYLLRLSTSSGTHAVRRMTLLK